MSCQPLSCSGPLPASATHQIGETQKSTVVNAAAQRPQFGRSGAAPSQTATGRTQIIWWVQVTGEISRPEVAHNATPRKGDQRKWTYVASATPRTPKTPARVHCSPGETVPWSIRAAAFRMPMRRALGVPMGGDRDAPPGLPGGAFWWAGCRRSWARCRG